jgi:hypothetical protein
VRLKLFLLAALVMLPLLGSATAIAFPTDWKQKPYFVAIDSELRLTTTQPGFVADCDWKGPKGGTYATNVNNLDWTDFGCITNALWAKTCKGAAQTVQFQKKIYLPGKALDLDVSLYSVGAEPLTMGIDINGAAAVTALKTIHKRDLRGKEQLFKSGINTITVHARKPKTGADPCNVNGIDYAFGAQIRAKFAADIKVTPPPVGLVTSYRAPLTVENAGPSDASLYSVAFGVYTSNLITRQFDFAKVAILIQGPGIDISKCLYGYTSIYYKSVSYTGYSTSCPILEPLAAGESRTYEVSFGYKNSAKTFFEQFPVTWGAAGDLFDPKQGNSGGGRLGYACKPAHPPECKG